MTTNLGAPQVADNQDQKETTINDAVGRIDAAVTDIFTCEIDDANDFGVAADDFQSHMQFDCTNVGATAGFALRFEASVRKGLFVVTNGAGQIASVQVDGQSSPPTLADGDIGLFFCDGVLVRLIA